jgi:hypothetical protein
VFRRATNPERLYRRQLPGGGFVAIEATPFRTLMGARRYRGEIVVERRANRGRREGHRAPIVATVTSESVATVLHTLFPLAYSNCAIATQFTGRRPAD